MIYNIVINKNNHLFETKVENNDLLNLFSTNFYLNF